MLEEEVAQCGAVGDEGTAFVSARACATSDIVIRQSYPCIFAYSNDTQENKEGPDEPVASTVHPERVCEA